MVSADGSRSGSVQIGAGGHLLVEGWADKGSQKMSGTQSEDISYR